MMGGIISRWRKRPSTSDVLEKLNKDIEAMEKMKLTNLQQQKRIIGSLVLYSVLVYIIAALVFYFYYFPENLPDRLLYSSPLLVFPLLVIFLKKFLHWYFVKRINKNESKLEDLREKKNTILEEVMEKETYKKAKEILEKFDPERFKKLEPEKGSPAPQRAPDGQELRNRSVMGSPRAGNPPPGSPGAGPHPQGATPRLPPGQGRPTPGLPMSAAQRSLQRNGQQRMMTPIPMPRPILPRERTTTDKIVEYLVGDGPSNRYALICRQCKSHNGMALKEEFEYLAFRCCYCYTENPARKQRPFAPKLETSPVPGRRRLAQEMTDSPQNQEKPSPKEKEEEEKEEDEEDMMEVEENDSDIRQEVMTSETRSGEQAESKVKDRQSKKDD